MGFLNNINAVIVEYLGPLGPMILLGTLGLIMIAVTVALMLSQPEDPIEKLKKQIQTPTANAPEQRLRQGERNEQFERHGHGVYWFADGGVYEGEWRHNLQEVRPDVT